MYAHFCAEARLPEHAQCLVFVIQCPVEISESRIYHLGQYGIATGQDYREGTSVVKHHNPLSKVSRPLEMAHPYNVVQSRSRLPDWHFKRNPGQNASGVE